MFLVFGRMNAADAEWSRWVRAYAEATVEHGVRSLLVVSRGGGPNARQQAEIRVALAERLDREALDIRTAVCSDHLSAHLITRAIAWLSGIIYMQSFRYDQREEAASYLKVPEARRPELLRALSRAEAEISESSRPGGRSSHARRGDEAL